MHGSLEWYEQKKIMRSEKFAGILAGRTRGCTICFPMNIRNVHWYVVVADSDTNSLRVWKRTALDTAVHENR